MGSIIRIHLKEAFNLLQGRSVFKEITPLKDEKYFAWIQLNFREKESDGNYKITKFRSYRGFDLGPILTRYPILELGYEDENVDSGAWYPPNPIYGNPSFR